MWTTQSHSLIINNYLKGVQPFFVFTLTFLNHHKIVELLQEVLYFCISGSFFWLLLPTLDSDVTFLRVSDQQGPLLFLKIQSNPILLSVLSVWLSFVSASLFACIVSSFCLSFTTLKTRVFQSSVDLTIQYLCDFQIYLLENIHWIASTLHITLCSPALCSSLIPSRLNCGYIISWSEGSEERNTCSKKLKGFVVEGRN